MNLCILKGKKLFFLLVILFPNLKMRSCKDECLQSLIPNRDLSRIYCAYRESYFIQVFNLKIPVL